MARCPVRLFSLVLRPQTPLFLLSSFPFLIHFFTLSLLSPLLLPEHHPFFPLPHFALIAFPLLSSSFSSRIFSPLPSPAPATANGTAKPVPTVTINLDAAPQDRWTDIVTPRKEYLATLVNYVIGLIPK